MEIEKLPLIIADINMRLENLEKGMTPSNKDLSAIIEPAIVGVNISIPLLNRTIAVDYIDNEENYTWQQAMDYCKGKGLELPSRDDAPILMWQFDKINVLLRTLGKDEMCTNSWFWTKTESSDKYAWLWISDSRNDYGKTSSGAVVPFFAID